MLPLLLFGCGLTRHGELRCFFFVDRDVLEDLLGSVLLVGGEVVGFGQVCRDSKNWQAGITLAVAEAHYRAVAVGHPAPALTPAVPDLAGIR